METQQTPIVIPYRMRLAAMLMQAAAAGAFCTVPFAVGVWDVLPVAMVLAGLLMAGVLAHEVLTMR